MANEVDLTREDFIAKFERRFQPVLEGRLVKYWQDSEMILANKNKWIANVFRIDFQENVSKLTHEIAVKLTKGTANVLRKVFAEKTTIPEGPTGPVFDAFQTTVDFCLNTYFSEIRNGLKIKEALESDNAFDEKNMSLIWQVIQDIVKYSEESVEHFIRSVEKDTIRELEGKEPPEGELVKVDFGKKT